MTSLTSLGTSSGTPAAEDPRSSSTPLPLTGSQRGIVAACLVDPDTTDFMVGDVLRLDGLGAFGADPHAVVQEAVRRVAAETPWLGWRVQGGPEGRLVPGDGLRVSTHDLRGAEDAGAGDAGTEAAGTEDAWDRAFAWARRDVSRSLPPDEGGLARIRVWMLSDTSAAVSLAVHHVLLDGYGVHLVLHRILRTCLHLSGQGPAPRPWTDPQRVVEEEAEYLASARAVQDRAFWAAHPPAPEAAHSFRLPRATRGERADRATRTAGATTDAADTEPVVSALRVDIALDARARTLDATFVEVLAAAHAVVLSRWTGQRDVVLGIPLMNRAGSAAAAAATCTVNVLPLAVLVDPAHTPRALVAQVARGLRDLRRHGRFRAEELLTLHEHLALGTVATGTELNVKLFGALPGAPGVRAAIVALAEGPVDDVSVSVVPGESDTELRFSAPPGTSAAALDALASTFVEVLDDIAAAPDAPFGHTAARDRRASAAATALSIAGRTVVDPAHPPFLWDRLAAVAAAHPRRPALAHHDEQWDHSRVFAEVVSRTAALAARTEPGQPVILDLPRDLDALAWYLAATACGRPGVPVDTRWPRARKAALAEHLAAASERCGTPPPRILTRAEVAAWRVPATVPPAADELAVAQSVWAGLRGSSHAYVIHTSGSTGVPKPVLIGQGALARHLATYGAHMWEHPDAERGPLDHHVAALTLPLVFDGSWDMLSAVVWGHTVRLIDHDTAQDPRACASALRTHGVTAIDSTPTVVTALLDEGLLDAGHTLTQANVGGEACPAHVWDRLTAARTRSGRPLRVQNYYGPTESTVDATRLASLDPEDSAVTGKVAYRSGSSLIGRGVEGTVTAVLDHWLRPVPHGVLGELHLSGEQLAHGYLGLTGRTSERFVADPFGPPGARMYRTGDLVRMLPTGHLVYEGRSDDQLKVRGYRVEPREVEAALERLSGIRQALVRSDGTRLLAWVIPSPASDDDDAVSADAETGRTRGRESEALRQRAAAILPDHLLPAAILPLPAFPRTATGKIDVAALPLPSAGETGRPAEGPAELAISAAFAEVLGVVDPGAEADFFRLGGDSIRAIRLVALVRDRGFLTSVSHIFAQRTLAGIGRTCTPLDQTAATGGRRTPPVADLVSDPAALAAVTALLQTRSAHRERSRNR